MPLHLLRAKMPAQPAMHFLHPDFIMKPVFASVQGERSGPTFLPPPHNALEPGRPADAPAGVASTYADAALQVPLIVYCWRLLRREKLLLAVPAMLCTMAFVAVALQMTPTYRASATVVFDGGQRRPVLYEEVYRAVATDQGAQLTQAEFLQTTDVALRVIRELGLVGLPEFVPGEGIIDRIPTLRMLADRMARLLPSAESNAGTRESDEEFALGRFKQRLSVDRLSQTQLFRVSFVSVDPHLAASVANAVVAAYVRADMDARYEATREANAWLSDRLVQLKQALERSEKRLQDYRQRNGLLARSTDVATERQLAEITQRLIDIRARRTALEESFIQANHRELETALATPAVASNPMVMRAREAESAAQRRLADLRNLFGPEHPQYRGAMGELNAARDSVRQELSNAVRTISKELAAAQAAEKQMEAALANARAAGQNLDRKEIELKQLEREVGINRQLYETFLARNKEIAAASDFQQAAARLADPALVPTQPTRPPLAMIGGFGGMVGLLLGLVVVLVRDRLRNTLRTMTDVESGLGMPLLAAVPLLERGETAHAARHFIIEPHSLFADAIRNAATGIALSNLDGTRSIIAVGSALNNEGKTTVACNLALALSSSRRMLLIDADLHRPSVCRALGLDSSGPGLSQLLEGRSRTADCLQGLPGTSLTVLAAGRVAGKALDLLMGARLRSLANELREQFDLIILDTPPSQLVSDGMILGRIATGMVLVVRSDSTPLPVVSRALRRAEATGTDVLGVVLNAHDFKRADRYYGENSGYRDLSYRYGYDFQPLSAAAQVPVWRRRRPRA
jgi:capsular exopolysaccharide synthesis family protein